MKNSILCADYSRRWRGCARAAAPIAETVLDAGRRRARPGEISGLALDSRRACRISIGRCKTVRDLICPSRRTKVAHEFRIIQSLPEATAGLYRHFRGGRSMDFIYFLGRFHVLVLHIPIGIVIAVFLLELLIRRDRFKHLESAAGFLWGACAVSAIVTVILGYMHFAEGGFEGSSGIQHRNFGTAVAVILSVVAALRVSKFGGAYRPVFLPAATLLVILVSMTGHFGGNLTHGSTYLIEYAPQPIRSLAGLPPRRPPVTDLMMADPFLDIVGKFLYQRCTGCHNPDQRQAELDMTTHMALMRGGETGTVLTPGRPEVSEMVRRVTLPPGDDAYMPAEGRTPLTDDQVQILQWWIRAGAPTGATLGELDIALTDDERAMLSREVGL